MTASISKVTDEGDYYHVRFRPPSQFETERTPQWASNVADSVSSGTKVRTGKTSAGNWLVQSVLVPTSNHSKRDARSIAKKVDRKIENSDH